MRRPLIVVFVLAPLLLAGALFWWTGGKGPASDMRKAAESVPPAGPGEGAVPDLAPGAERPGKLVPEELPRRADGEARRARRDEPWVQGRTGGADPEVGFPAPDFTLQSLDGSWIRLSDWRGEKAVIVNFWATWCPPCREEMPDFEQLRAERGHEVEIVAVNLYEGPDVVQAFYDELGLTFPAALDRNGNVHQRYLVRPLPTSFVVDKAGIIRGRYFGAMSYDVMERLVDLALEATG